MPRLEYFLVAEAVSIDQTTNKLSIFNVLEEARAPQFPSNLSSLAAVACFINDPGDLGNDFQALFRTTGTALSGQQFEFALNFNATGARSRLVQRVNGLPLLAAGELRFEVLLNAQHQASHHVTVLSLPPP